MTRGVLRLWVLGGIRRPARAVLFVLALALMGTATLGALVAADGLSRLFDRDAAAEWGPVDVEGHATRDSVFDDSLGRFLVTKAGARITAGAPRLALHGAVGTETALVLGLGAEEQGFPDTPAVGRLAATQALANERLARRLHLRAGDRVRVVIAVPEWSEQRSDSSTPLKHPATTARLELTVAAVVPDRGVADLHRTPNLLMTRSALQRATGLEPGKSTVLDLHLATPGRKAADDLVDALDPVARRAGMALLPVHADALDAAGEEGGLFRSLLLTLALLVVAAAAGGTVDLVLSLVRSRSAELAQLRALGAPTRLLRAAVVVECALYGVIGAALGAALAVPFAHALGGALADHLAHLNAGRGREQVALEAIVRLPTMIIGCVLLVVVAALAGRAAARRALSGEPDGLLRGEAPPVRPPTGVARPAWLLALGSAALGAGGGALVYLGVTLLLASAWVWRRRTTTAHDRWWAGLGLAWSVIGAALLGDFSHGVQAGFGVMAVAGEVAVVCGTVLVLPHLRALMRGLRLYAPRGPAQLALLVAGSRAERDADRSGLAVGVIGGLLFGVVALSVLGNAAALPLGRQSGGFTAVGTSVAGVDPAALQVASGADAVVAVPHVELPEPAYRVEHDDGTRSVVPYPVRLIAAEADLVSTQSFGLAASLPQYRTAREALTAVITDGDKVVLDRFSRPEGARPGDDVVLDLGAGPRRFRLAAVLDTYLLGGVLVGDAPFRELVPAVGDTFVLARGGNMQALQSAGADEGLDLKSTAQLAREVVDVNRSFTDVFGAMLGLGLLTAVVFLAAGVLRSGRERRGEIAVLRAAGLPRRSVAVLLAAQPVLLVLVGAALGTGTGLIVLRVLFAAGFSDLPFLLDGGRLAALVGIAIAFAAIACALAAWTRRDVAADALHDLG
jgi:ABC-type lipoprotein release transport system permease subunit